MKRDDARTENETVEPAEPHDVARALSADEQPSVLPANSPVTSRDDEDLPMLSFATDGDDQDDDADLPVLDVDEGEIRGRREQVAPERKRSLTQSALPVTPASPKWSATSAGTDSESDLPVLSWWYAALFFGGGSIAIGLLAGLVVHYFRTPQPVVADKSPSVKVEPPNTNVSAPPAAAPSTPNSMSQPTVTVSPAAAETTTKIALPPSPTLVFEPLGAHLGQPLDTRQYADQTKRKLPRLGSGFLNLLKKTGSYSPLPPDAPSGLSWRVHLLPHLNLQPLYDQFHLDEPWDSPHNRTLIEKMPDDFRLSDDVGLTRFRIFTGPDMPFEPGHTVRPQDFTDGESTTALVFVVGRDKAVPWTKPDDEAFQRHQPLESLGLQPQDPFAALTAGTFILRIAGVHPERIAALATARGGELVYLPHWFQSERAALEPQFVIDPQSATSFPKLSAEQEHLFAREKLATIGNAMQKQHAQIQKFNPAAPTEPGWRQLSWRVHLLPYLGYDELYRQFHLNESWDSPHNLTLIEHMPEVFRFQTSAGRTRFAVLFGDQLLFSQKEIASLNRVSDDPATTAAVFYVAPQRATTWTEPEWLILSRDQPRITLGVAVEDSITMLFANGAVTTLPPSAHSAKLFALATARGGEAIDLPTWFGSAEVAAKPPSATVTPPTPIRNAVHVPAVAAPDSAKLLDLALTEVDPIAKKLSMIGLAFHHFHDIHRQFSIPQNVEWFDKDGHPKLSWRVHLLPFLNQNPLYEQFKLNEPWDSEHNRPLLSQMPDVFRSEETDKTTTRFCMLLGEQTLFRVGKKASIADIRDGASHTILVAHVGSDKALPWTKPDDLPFAAAHPLECLGNLGKQFHAVMADGTTLSIPTSLPPEVFAALATASGREIVDADTLRRYAAHHAGKPLVNALRRRVLEQNKLKQVLLAMHNFHDTNRHFPPARQRKQLDTEGRPLLSWRVHLLRFLDHEPLAQQFRFEEPWDSPHNLQLLPLMPDVFRDSQAPVDSTTTRWMTFSGPSTPFPHLPANIERGTSIRDFRDGTSNTILVMQAAPDRAVPWTKPDDLEVDLAVPLECLGTIPADTGLLTGLADGSVRTVTRAITAEQFKALITPNGKEVIDAASILK